MSRQVHLQVGLSGPSGRGRVPPPRLLLGRLLHLLVVVVPAGSRAGVRDGRARPGWGWQPWRGAGRYRASWFRRMWCTKPWLMSSRPPGLQQSPGPGPGAASIWRPCARSRRHRLRRLLLNRPNCHPPAPRAPRPSSLDFRPCALTSVGQWPAGPNVPARGVPGAGGAGGNGACATSTPGRGFSFVVTLSVGNQDLGLVLLHQKIQKNTKHPSNHSAFGVEPSRPFSCAWML